jgi:predicted metal-dependent enzyme (double-stranded beta helix superfamily)
VDLHAIASGLAETALFVPLDHCDATRRYTRMLSTSSYDAWVIWWSPSAELDLHDHGGSIGVVHVVEGELVEQHADLVTGGPLRSETVRVGHTARTASTTVHAVANLGPRDALSVHVYSPPLSTMTFYADVAGRLEPIHVEDSRAGTEVTP